MSAFILPPPSRPRGSWNGAVAWFFAGAIGAVALGALAAAIGSAGGSAALLVLAVGVCAGVWLSTRLPHRHGAALVIGGTAAVLSAFGVFVYELTTTPWTFM